MKHLACMHKVRKRQSGAKCVTKDVFMLTAALWDISSSIRIVEVLGQQGKNRNIDTSAFGGGACKKVKDYEEHCAFSICSPRRLEVKTLYICRKQVHLPFQHTNERTAVICFTVDRYKFVFSQFLLKKSARRAVRVLLISIDSTS